MKLRANAIAAAREMRAPLLTAAFLRVSAMLAAYACTGTRIMTQGDTSSYLEPGRSLFLQGVFATAGQPEIDRTPGYPIFAMLTGMAVDNVLLTATAQILLSLLSLLLIRRIGDLVYPGRNIGLRAAWLYAVEPLSILYTFRLMPETLFIVLLLFSIERLLIFQRAARLSNVASAGISLAAATFVRPVTWYLGLLLAAGIVFTTRQRSLRWKAPAVLLLTFVPWLAAWQIRNAVETGYSGFSSIVEKNLYFFQSAEVTAELQHISLEAEQEKLGYPNESAYLAAHPEQLNWTRFQRLRFMRAQSIQILVQHPALYLKTHFAGVAAVALSPCATEWLQMFHAYPGPQSMPRRILNEGVVASIHRILLSHPGVTLAMAFLEVLLLILYALAFCGFLSTQQNRLSACTLLGIALYFLLISGGAQAVGRYRLPVMPILCVFAAAGIPLSRAKEMRGHQGPAVELHSIR
jgi:hypothetical protein